MAQQIKTALVVANGEKPKSKIIEYLLRKEKFTIVAADGGLKNCEKLSLQPDIIIGDLDSAPKKLLQKYSANSVILRQEGQDDTDLEKAIKYLIKNRFTSAFFVGIAGGRMDHQMANLSLLIKYNKKLRMTFITNESVVLPVNGKLSLSSFPGEVVSVYNFHNSVIKSEGLLYALGLVEQKFGVSDSTSNVSTADSFTITAKSGGCVLVRQVKALMNHGLL